MFPTSLEKEADRVITRDIESQIEYTVFIFTNNSVCNKISKRLKRRQIWNERLKDRRNVLLIEPKDFFKVILNKHQKGQVINRYSIILGKDDDFNE